MMMVAYSNPNLMGLDDVVE